MPRKPQEFEGHPVPFGDARKAGFLRAVCRDVVDGDTVDVFIDLGFHNYAYETLRLQGIDTPEIFRPKSEEERVRGNAAKDRVVELILYKPVMIRSYKGRSTFGRFVADVLVEADVDSPLVDFEINGHRWFGLAGILKVEGYEK